MAQVPHDDYSSTLPLLKPTQDDGLQVLTVGISSLKANFVTDWGLISAASLLETVQKTLSSPRHWWKTLAGLAVLLGSCFRRNDDIGFLAQSLLIAIPITILFLLLQRFFLAQNLSGALKV